MIEREASPRAPPMSAREQLREAMAFALYSESVSQRTQALAHLRNNGSKQAGDELSIVMQLDQSVFCRYEATRFLGQMRHVGAFDKLKSTVRNLSEHPDVRIAAAQALAAIGDTRALPLLLEWSNVIETDAPANVRSACSRAAERLQWVAAGGDPASPIMRPTPEHSDIPAASATLADGEADLYDRYSALLTLRDARATRELCSALAIRADPDSEQRCIRHEIAVVLGELADPAAVRTLGVALADTSECEVVRREAFQALGCIGSEACRRILANYEAVVHPRRRAR